jgi:hypothetical protein
MGRSKMSGKSKMKDCDSRHRSITSSWLSTGLSVYMAGMRHHVVAVACSGHRRCGDVDVRLSKAAHNRSSSQRRAKLKFHSIPLTYLNVLGRMLF